MDLTNFNFFQIWSAGFGSFLNDQIVSSGFLDRFEKSSKPWFEVQFFKQFEIFEFDSPLAGLQKIFFLKSALQTTNHKVILAKR